MIVEFGAGEARGMLNPPLALPEDAAGAAAAAAVAGGAGVAAAEVAAGRKAPRELEQLLEMMLKWE